MAKKVASPPSVLGVPRTFKLATKEHQIVENMAAMQEFWRKIHLLTAMIKVGITTGFSTICTTIRREHGVMVRTPFGYTTQPHGLTATAELIRRKHLIMSYMHNCMGLCDYIKKYAKRLNTGLSPAERVNCRQMLAWALDCYTTLKSLEIKHKVTHL